jgi:heme/copper-type cytochrome/quinol oxidase subunit 4
MQEQGNKALIIVSSSIIALRMRMYLFIFMNQEEYDEEGWRVTEGFPSSFF